MTAPKAPEKRKESRLPLELRVQIVRGDLVQTHLCSDISTGGLFVRTDENWRNGEQVLVRLFLPGQSAPIAVHGEVVRVSHGRFSGLGIRFLEQKRELQRFYANRGPDLLRHGETRVLLVHPEEPRRFFLRTILGADGYQVTECRSADEAETALRSGTFDVIVADPLARRVSGETFDEWLATRRFGGRIIYVTEGEMVGGQPQVLATYVAEPIDVSQLRGLLAESLQRP